jgi:hypothetical protein
VAAASSFDFLELELGCIQGEGECWVISWVRAGLGIVDEEITIGFCRSNVAKHSACGASHADTMQIDNQLFNEPRRIEPGSHKYAAGVFVFVIANFDLSVKPYLFILVSLPQCGHGAARRRADVTVGHRQPRSRRRSGAGQIAPIA